MDTNATAGWEIETWTFGSADGAPEPVAPYAHATAAGPLVFVTGQLPIEPVSNDVVGIGDVTAQTHQVMVNLEAVLARVGSSFDRVLMSRVYLTSMDLYDACNREYETWFPDRLPSRTCVGVTGLARGCLVEIDLIALR